jgi:hypothetical protein
MVAELLTFGTGAEFIGVITNVKSSSILKGTYYLNMHFTTWPPLK